MLKTVLFFASVCLAAAPATSDAATMQAIYSGMVSESHDQTGLFGQGAGASLDGQSYTLTFTYDPAMGSRTTGPAVDEVYGGTVYGTLSPIFGAVLTIGGVSKSLSGASIAFVRQREFFGTDHLDHYAQDDAVDPLTGLISQAIAYQWAIDPGNLLPMNLDMPFSLSGPVGTGLFGGYFGFFLFDPVLNQYLTATRGSLSPGNLRVSVVSPAAVPLPAGAGLLLLALVALGATRQRLSRIPGTSALEALCAPRQI